MPPALRIWTTTSPGMTQSAATSGAGRWFGRGHRQGRSHWQGRSEKQQDGKDGAVGSRHDAWAPVRFAEVCIATGGRSDVPDYPTPPRTSAARPDFVPAPKGTDGLGRPRAPRAGAGGLRRPPARDG